ncbi:MAG: type II secretion system F family protein [Phycisphaeraceae bacterium]
MRLDYEAYDASGRQVRDTIKVASEADAREELRRRGLFVTELTRGRGGAAAEQPTVARGRRSTRGRKRLHHLAMFTRQLYVLESTGTPTVQALAALERQTRDPAWKAVTADLRRRVEEGSALSEAMASHGACFDPVYRSLVAAGESSGQFGPMLDRLAQLVRKQAHLRSTVAGAMIYPALLLAVAGTVLAVMMLFVMPRFKGVFATLDVPLPASTQMMMAASELMQHYWWALILLIGGAAAGGWAWLRTPGGRTHLDAILVRLPLIGPAVRSFATARVARLLGTLLISHVPLTEALKLTREAAGNARYRQLVRDAEDAVDRGNPISTAFANPKLVQPAVYEAICSGEATGQIGPLLLNIAEFLDEDNDVLLRSLTSILEPVILIILGLLVGSVAVSLFLPLFDLTAAAGGVN